MQEKQTIKERQLLYTKLIGMTKDRLPPPLWYSHVLTACPEKVVPLRPEKTNKRWCTTKIGLNLDSILIC